MNKRKSTKPVYYIYRPDAEKIMKRLAKKWKRQGLDCHFGYLMGIPITREDK